MKTIEEILQGKFTVESEGKKYVFTNGTPIELANKIVQLHKSQTRIILDYGDIKSNKSWGEVYDITGRIGVSKGFYDLRWPILVYNSRSIGGGTILTDCIISIKESKGKRLIYKNQIA